MTPAQYRLVLAAHHEERMEARRIAAWQALTTAVLGRVKRMPPLERLFRDLGAQPPRQRRTPEQLLAMARATGVGTFEEKQP